MIDVLLCFSVGTARSWTTGAQSTGKGQVGQAQDFQVQNVSVLGFGLALVLPCCCCCELKREFRD